MARIVSTGAVLSVLHFPPGVPGDGTNLEAVQFARLSDGTVVTVNREKAHGPGLIVDIETATKKSLRDAIDFSFLNRDLPNPHRLGFWQGLVRALAAQGIPTDPETLLALPFTMELDDEVLGLLTVRVQAVELVPGDVYLPHDGGTFTVTQAFERDGYVGLARRRGRTALRGRVPPVPVCERAPPRAASLGVDQFQAPPVRSCTSTSSPRFPGRYANVWSTPSRRTVTSDIPSLSSAVWIQ